MSEIYEELYRLFGGREGSGLTTMSLVSLPPSVRSVVQLMLRNRGEMTYPALREAVEKLPENKRLSQAELDEILDAMTRLDLLVRSEQKKVATYKVNLGPTTSGTRVQSRPSKQASEARARADEVWAALGSEETDAQGAGNFLQRLLQALGLKSGQD